MTDILNTTRLNCDFTDDGQAFRESVRDIVDRELTKRYCPREPRPAAVL